jgi:hypothetical protein
MKIRMIEQITGTRDGVRWPAPGGTVDLPAREATKLCAAGSAEPVADPPKPERAVATKPETRKK